MGRPAAVPVASLSAGAPAGLGLGLTESNANLLWSAAERPVAPAGFGPFRGAVAALAPAYLRVDVNWAALAQPGRPPALDLRVDGCERGLAPCAPYAGVAEQLAAVASLQRTGGRVRPVIVILGTPVWAATPPGGCERPDTSSHARPITAAGLAAYRALVRSLLALGRREGVALPFWSAWNEPNHPLFLSPQRERCDVRSPSRAPAVYASLVRALRAELSADGGGHALVLGELAALPRPEPRSTGLAEFVRDLPTDVLCAGRLWAVHEYARRGTAAGGPGAVARLERALDARGRCGRRARIWVTETGAGAPHAGLARSGSPADQRAGCRALAAELARWSADPRVQAAFQYTFREDPYYPVGLADARLTHLYPAYDLWRAWAGRQEARGAAPPLPSSCRG